MILCQSRYVFEVKYSITFWIFIITFFVTHSLDGGVYPGKVLHGTGHHGWYVFVYSVTIL